MSLTIAILLYIALSIVMFILIRPILAANDPYNEDEL